MRRGAEEQAVQACDAQSKRLRSWPHIKGNYASFASFPLLCPAAALEPLVSAALEKVPPHIPVFEPFAAADLHISVSRTFPVPKPQLVRFTRLMCSAISEAELSAFKVVLESKPCLLVNEAGTTTFLAFTVDVRHSGHEELLQVSSTMDAVLAKLGFPLFYEPPRFHVSVAWATGNFGNDCAWLEDQWHVMPVLTLKRLDLLVGEDIHSFELE
jgi:hypothetical protein